MSQQAFPPSLQMPRFTSPRTASRPVSSCHLSLSRALSSPLSRFSWQYVPLGNSPIRRPTLTGIPKREFEPPSFLSLSLFVGLRFLFLCSSLELFLYHLPSSFYLLCKSFLTFFSSLSLLLHLVMFLFLTVSAVFCLPVHCLPNL